MVQTAKSLSDEEKSLLDWGKDSRKNNLAIANEVLGKIATLSATIAGGGVILLNETVIVKFLIAPILVLFLISLATSFRGVLPYKADVDLDSPTEIETHKAQALEYKLKKIQISSICFFLGLSLAVVGVSYNALCS